MASDDIRAKLIAKGIPAEEIAYIHDAKTEQQKADLFDNVNRKYGMFNRFCNALVYARALCLSFNGLSIRL